MAISKKMMNINALQEVIQLFTCPICSQSMQIVENAHLVCVQNHSFDISRQGYVNLAPQAHTTKYDKTLFEARNIMMTYGFFDPLLARITETIQQYMSDEGRAVILDAGSGEGSQVAQIMQELSGQAVNSIGIDLAKEGIASAAKNYPGSSWVVADLANCPFEDRSFDVLLNILSPANYEEFTRLLKEDGLFIKVVPEKDYLKQLRVLFYEGEEREKDNQPATAVTKHFKDMTTERVTYDFPLNSLLLDSLIRMTPLAWGASKDKIENARLADIPFVTIDFTVIVGRNK